MKKEEEIRKILKDLVETDRVYKKKMIDNYGEALTEMAKIIQIEDYRIRIMRIEKATKQNYGNLEFLLREIDKNESNISLLREILEIGITTKR